MPKLVEISEEYKKNLFPYLENYDDLQVTDVGLYSITKRYENSILTKIVLRTLKANNLNPETLTITDGTSGNGADVIAFANHFKCVIAVELDPLHCEVVKNNVSQYKVNKKVRFICPNDYLKKYKRLKQDIIYLDPPWGGPEYKQQKKTVLYLGKTKVNELIPELLKKCKYFFMKCPLNVDMENIKNYNVKIIKNRKKIPKFKLVIIRGEK